MATKRFFRKVLDLINVPVIQRNNYEIRRIDIILAIGFVICVTYYYLVYGPQYAVLGAFGVRILSVGGLMADVVKEVECPCCHGQIWLRLYSEQFPDEAPQRVMCCHCFGLGVVPAATEYSNDQF